MCVHGEIVLVFIELGSHGGGGGMVVFRFVVCCSVCACAMKRCLRR
jgi:hypothetical protein